MFSISLGWFRLQQKATDFFSDFLFSNILKSLRDRSLHYQFLHFVVNSHWTIVEHTNGMHTNHVWFLVRWCVWNPLSRTLYTNFDDKTKLKFSLIYLFSLFLVSTKQLHVQIFFQCENSLCSLGCCWMICDWNQNAIEYVNCIVFYMRIATRVPLHSTMNLNYIIFHLWLLHCNALHACIACASIECHTAEVKYHS